MKNVSKVGYWVIAMMMAALLVSFEIGFDRLESHYGVHGPAAYFDEALIALSLSGLVMYLLRRVRVERERQAHAIRMMNVHVRNALQSILYAEHLGGPDRKQTYIMESVCRIERAVREVSNGADSDAERAESFSRELTRMNAN